MSLSKAPPCKKKGKPCDKRHVGCHSKCKEYIEWRKTRDDEKAQIDKERQIGRQLDDTNFQRIRKMKARSK